ncbi:Spermatogenesis-associated protein 22 [Larimichthys crocea]|uniref:Uncharacterized protein n=1 Tax=Larimichthys crocea TaxID=215358 RepID=A0ACD3R6E0_LARCR|nr:Spermatogenesis-associated protein 22 [Larimichthys crocea]
MHQSEHTKQTKTQHCVLSNGSAVILQTTQSPASVFPAVQTSACSYATTCQQAPCSCSAATKQLLEVYEQLRATETSSSTGNKNTNQPRTAQQTQTVQMKPVAEHSLRILTAVIDGMRHWSQFKDKVPYLFEIFASLDSAVTLGPHGAKNFLMRDGKEVVQCVFYENEQELPRLIRGQVHRCVGNYDRNRDVLTCVSVRPCHALRAEERTRGCESL